MASVVLALAAVIASLQSTQQPRPQSPFTTIITYSPWENVSRSDVAFDIPLQELSDQRSSPFQPEQISLHHASPSEVWFHFATGEAHTGVGMPPPPLPAPSQPPFVKVATSGDSSTTTTITRGVLPSGCYTKQTSSEEAVQGTTFNASCQSPHLWTVKVTNLQPDTSYSYVIDNSDEAYAPTRSSPQSFRTLPAVGSRKALRVGMFGDLGQTRYSRQTLQRLGEANPDIIFNMGDFTYADAFDADAAPHGSIDSGSAISGAKWDAWGRLTSPLFSKVPHQGAHGNHEKSERNRGVMDSLQYSRRYPTAHTSSPSNLYYSFSFGLVKAVFLSPYMDYSSASAQYAWFKDECESRLNRTATPWLVLVFHAPVYSSYTAHYKEVECFRQLYEPLWTEYGVDILFSGHVHAYERSNPVHSYGTDPSGCAPTFVTIGDGGNHEGIYQTYEDQSCPVDGVASAAMIARYYGDTGDDSCVPGDQATYSSGKRVPYCDKAQPRWSAYREDGFGHGLLDVHTDGKTAEWAWHSNTGSRSVSTDTFLMQRDIVACPKRAFGTPL